MCYLRLNLLFSAIVVIAKFFVCVAARRSVSAGASDRIKTGLVVVFKFRGLFAFGTATRYLFQGRAILSDLHPCRSRI